MAEEHATPTAGTPAALKERLLYLGYDARQSQTNATSVVGVGKIQFKGEFTDEGLKVNAIKFVGNGTPGYSGGAVYNTNMEIIGLMDRVRDEWFADGTTQHVNLAFSIAPLLEYEKTNNQAQGARPPK